MCQNKNEADPDILLFMKKALEEAEAASRSGEVPVGALVVHNRRIIGRGHNVSIAENDPTAHAEIMAIREACRTMDNYRIPDSDLYVTLEPCAMCLGAALQARIRRIFYGASDPKAGAASSVMSFPFERLNHKIEIKGGILERESSIILKNFFQNRRKHAERWPSG
jgi:tRNA(adenine34) deaminase